MILRETSKLNQIYDVIVYPSKSKENPSSSIDGDVAKWKRGGGMRHEKESTLLIEEL